MTKLPLPSGREVKVARETALNLWNHLLAALWLDYCVIGLIGRKQ